MSEESLGFNLIRLLKFGGEVVVHPCSLERLALVKDVIAAQGIESVRVSFSNNTLFVKKPLLPHEIVTGKFSSRIGHYNSTLSGNLEIPVVVAGSVNVSLAGTQSYYVPDTAMMSEDRVDQSPNLIQETHFRSELTIQQFIQKGINYINLTTNVMSVILVKIYEYQILPVRCIGLVLCELRRMLPVPAAAPFHHFRPLVSFGNTALHAADQNEWTVATNNAGFTGVGFLDGNCQPFPACNAFGLPAYSYEVPGQLVVCLDNFGLQFPAGLNTVPGTANPLPYVIDLHAIIRALLRTAWP